MLYEHELSMQIHEVHVDVAPLSEMYLKLHWRLLLPKCHFYLHDCFLGKKRENSHCSYRRP